MATRRTITQVSAWVEPEFAAEFARLARRNERTISGEARVALRRHFEEAQRPGVVRKVAVP